MFERVRMPSLGGATGWLNSKPLGPAELRSPNVIYVNELDEGGHFAAWQEPDLFTTEVRAAFRSLRNGGPHE